MVLSSSLRKPFGQLAFYNFRNSSTFFITTPIFYVNAAPHIGHLYSAVIADAGHRFQRLLGVPSILSTGTDEHGTKIQKAAEDLKIPLPQYCETVSSKFRETFDQFGIDYNFFIRTSEERHIDCVTKFWETLSKNGFIYPGSYSGWYCDADEAFLTESQIAILNRDGQEIRVSAESARPVHWVQEHNHKFKLSHFQDEIVRWLKLDESVRPEKFKRQLFSWLEGGLLEGDVSISRPVGRVHWGIPVPGDPGQTVYVWLDALVNYLTAAGYPRVSVWPPTVQVIGKDILKYVEDNTYFVTMSLLVGRDHWGIPVPGDPGQTVYVWLDALVNYLTVAGYPRVSVWPPTVQVIGKDILKFHGIYWPAFLMAHGLEPPRSLLVHSHWTVEGEKMSKSLGNVVCPSEAGQRFTVEGLRYFLLREGTPASDSNYSETKALRILNSELADTLGNLLNRCCAKSINSRQEFPEFQSEHYEKFCKEIASDLIIGMNMLQDEVRRHFEDFNFYRGISIIISNLHAANKFFESSKPWELAKSPGSEDHLNCILHITMETLRLCGIALQPIVPELSSVLLNKLSIPLSGRSWNDLTPSWSSKSTKSTLLDTNKVVLYKRIYQ